MSTALQDILREIERRAAEVQATAIGAGNMEALGRIRGKYEGLLNARDIIKDHIGKLQTEGDVDE